MSLLGGIFSSSTFLPFLICFVVVMNYNLCIKFSMNYQFTGEIWRHQIPHCSNYGLWFLTPTLSCFLGSKALWLPLSTWNATCSCEPVACAYVRSSPVQKAPFTFLPQLFLTHHFLKASFPNLLVQSLVNLNYTHSLWKLLVFFSWIMIYFMDEKNI